MAKTKKAPKLPAKFSYSNPIVNLTTQIITKEKTDTGKTKAWMEGNVEYYDKKQSRNVFTKTPRKIYASPITDNWNENNTYSSIALQTSETKKSSYGAPYSVDLYYPLSEEEHNYIKCIEIVNELQKAEKEKKLESTFSYYMNQRINDSKCKEWTDMNEQISQLEKNIEVEKQARYQKMEENKLKKEAEKILQQKAQEEKYKAMQSLQDEINAHEKTHNYRVYQSDRNRIKLSSTFKPKLNTLYNFNGRLMVLEGKGTSWNENGTIYAYYYLKTPDKLSWDERNAFVAGNAETFDFNPTFKGFFDERKTVNSEFFKYNQPFEVDNNIYVFLNCQHKEWDPINEMNLENTVECDYRNATDDEKQLYLTTIKPKIIKKEAEYQEAVNKIHNWHRIQKEIEQKAIQTKPASEENQQSYFPKGTKIYADDTISQGYGNAIYLDEKEKKIYYVDTRMLEGDSWGNNNCCGGSGIMSELNVDDDMITKIKNGLDGFKEAQKNERIDFKNFMRNFYRQ